MARLTGYHEVNGADQHDNRLYEVSPDHSRQTTCQSSQVLTSWQSHTQNDVLVNVTNTRVPVNVQSCNVFIAK